ncbi:MAG: 4-(cytidine 5'-diphospho)-2-C-methyl-D-erythritol kinase [Planctomycetota bacterium]
MPVSVHHRAPAKLNLALAVGPPEETGMHPICSWMVTVSLFDELHLQRLMLDQLSRYAILWHDEAMRCSDIDWSINSDLAVRAHQLLESHVGQRLPIQMKLSKRIPVGGGLGGGSSNAAAMLRAVNELFELEISLEELAKLGATLGSDVPFLVHQGSAMVSGLGDAITRHTQPVELDVVLAFPDASCATGAVYRAFDEHGPGALQAEAIQASVDAATPRPVDDLLFNDLAEPAMTMAPAAREARERLRTLAERTVHVTGSGSTLFVLCDDPMHAEALANACTEQLGIPAVHATFFAG